jgi:hypothetical protein
MISAILKAVFYGFKLLASATLIYFVVCIFAFTLFLIVLSCDSGSCFWMRPKTDISTHSETNQSLLLPPAKQRLHNQTEVIENDILITSAPKKQKQTKTKKKTQTQATTASKPLEKMTSKELLAYAKELRIKGYSAIYRTQNKPGLLKLIQEQITA